MEFEFVQGTVLHTEGNWSLYTTSFSDLPLYGYYNPLSAQSILETEEAMFELIERDGPFDGVLGYSAGAALAAQVICSDIVRNPFKTPEERPFRFACLVNAISPVKVFRIDEEDVQEGNLDKDSAMQGIVQEALDEFLRPSATRARKSFHKRADMPDADAIREEAESLEIRLLANGAPFFSNGELGITRFDERFDGRIIDFPTLHIRCPEVEDMHQSGLHTLQLCEPDMTEEIHHSFGHDFPRGHQMLKNISRAFRDLADRAST